MINQHHFQQFVITQAPTQGINLHSVVHPCFTSTLLHSTIVATTNGNE